MRKRKAWRFVVGVAAMAMLSGCLSVKERLDEQSARVAVGDYAEAYAKAADEAADGGVDGTFWASEAGAETVMTAMHIASIRRMGPCLIISYIPISPPLHASFR